MKKLVLAIIGIIGVIALFFIINQFDSSPLPDQAPAQNIDPARFDYDNGFYIQWGLPEPPEVDIFSREIQDRYRRLHDPALANDPGFQWDRRQYRENYKNHYQQEFNKLRFDFKVYDAQHMVRKAKTSDRLLKNLHPNLKIILARYRAMIDAPFYSDFSKLAADSPVPNLLAWLQTAKLYTGVNLLRALDGDWTGGASNILDHIDFGKRAVKGSRFLINNLIAKAVTSISIQALADLMNQKECPPEVFEMIIARTPPLQYDEYGTRASLRCEYWGYKDQLDRWIYISEEFYPINKMILKLLTQKNRTMNMVYREISEAIRYESNPPYKWRQNMPEITRTAAGPFWWIQNPGGKFLFDHNFPPTHLKAVVLKSIRLKTYYQMLRISAQLHLHYKPENPVQAVLEEMRSDRAIDPCSGKPYIWDEAKQILYSIGIDRIDNGGVLQEDTVYGDFPLPVILYVQGS